VGGIAAVVTGIGANSLTIVPTASGSVADQAAITQTPNPTGVSINLQGITYANNNPDLQVRLVSAYDNALPTIADGNGFVSSFQHGQYASGFGNATDIQVIDLDDYVHSGGTSFTQDGQPFKLTFNGITTANIAYNANATIEATNIQNALQNLTNIGVGNVTVASAVVTNSYTPPGPVTGFYGFSVIFGGTLKNTPEPTMTINDVNDNVSTWQDGSSSKVTTTVNNPYTVTANQSLVLSVASTTGFVSGDVLQFGAISASITGVGSTTITVTPDSSMAAAAGKSATSPSMATSLRVHRASLPTRQPRPSLEGSRSPSPPLPTPSPRRT
jgi:hypothetical protein